MRLAGSTAVVVGVSHSVGYECARLFSREGAAVVAIDPDPAAVRRVQAETAGTPTAVRGFVAPLAAEAEVAEVAGRCADELGAIDALILCTSQIDWLTLEDPVDAWEPYLRTNLIAPLVYTKCFLPLLERSAAGSIVYLGSVDGLHGHPGLPAYSVAKGGLIALTHVMAAQCGPKGIRVNCIALAGTRFTIDPGDADPTGAGFERLVAATPLRRLAEPSEFATVALFLASPDASYVTGAVLPVDGGRTAVTPGTTTFA